MNDKKLDCLKMADLYWRKAFYAHRDIKIAYAKDLHEYGLFSLSQLAKIVRLRTVDLTRAGLKANAKGGRFEPETLTALISMRQSRLLEEKIPTRLVEIVVNGGTSWSCAAALTGLAYATYAKDVPAIDTRKKREVKFTAKDREAIVRAIRAGADRKLLAAEYSAHEETIGRIYRAHASL